MFGDSYEKSTARFVHYTSIDGALGIIRSHRLWMRHTGIMADYREVQHGYKILHDFFSNPQYNAEFRSALDSCALGSGQQTLEVFDQHWRGLCGATYITSLSEHCASEDEHGRLSMWRGFGTGARVALIFDIPVRSESTLALNLIFSPVAYLGDSDVHESLLAVAVNIRRGRDFLASLGRESIVKYAAAVLITAVTCLKHSGFREEREWRAVYLPQLAASPLMESSLESIAGIPQLVYKIPLDGGQTALADLRLTSLLSRVLVGPSEYASFLGASMVAELSKVGISNAQERVLLSNIPIRNL